MRSSADAEARAPGAFNGAEIAALSRAGLAERWRQFVGSSPPKRSTARLLALAVSYEEQLVASPEAHETEKQIARLVAKGRALATGDVARGAPTRRLSPGARLLREWRGRTLVVDVVEGGFVFDGAVYASLSAIARAATGAARNGPAFFGLREKSERARS
ncbi:MAG: DUF2924 domain-containing protein [Parvularculaceae bacterium]